MKVDGYVHLVLAAYAFGDGKIDWDKVKEAAASFSGKKEEAEKRLEVLKEALEGVNIEEALEKGLSVAVAAPATASAPAQAEQPKEEKKEEKKEVSEEQALSGLSDLFG